MFVIKKVGGMTVVYRDGIPLGDIEHALPEILPYICTNEELINEINKALSKYSVSVHCDSNHNDEVVDKLIDAIITMYDAVNEVVTYLNNKESEIVFQLKELKSKFITGKLSPMDLIATLENLAKTIGTAKWAIRDVFMRKLGMSTELFVTSISELKAKKK